MPSTLICTGGKLDNYKKARYHIEGKDLGEADVPHTILARHAKPARIVMICPGVAGETAKWYDELKDDGLPEPTIREVSIPHNDADIPTLLNELATVISEETENGNDIHLDFSFGLRSITVLALLTTDLLAAVAHGRISKLTCVNFEGSREEQTAEILDATPYLHLGRLRTAVDALERRGDIEYLAETIAAAIPDSLSEKDVGEAAELQRRLSLLRTSQIASKNSGRDLIRRIQKVLHEKALTLPILRPIAESVQTHLAPLDPGDRHALSPFATARLARWYFSHGHPAHALILAVEAAKYYDGSRDKEGRPTATPLACQPGDSPANFCYNERKKRNTLTHAQMPFPGFNDKSNFSRTISTDNIKDTVERFENLCGLLEDASTPEKIDRMVGSA